MRQTTECRAFELGSIEQSAETEIIGRAVVYDQETDLGDFRECIEQGALAETDMRDVRFLVNHDTSQIPLARSRNNNEHSTMQLIADDQGLLVRVRLDTSNPQAASLLSAIKRGDVSGMSFMYTVSEQEWAGLDTGEPLRKITKIGKIYEVSAVTFPAYEGTTLEAASAAKALESAVASLESERVREKTADIIERIASCRN